MVKTLRRSTVLVAALVGAAVALTIPSAGLGSKATADASCQLSVFSWWTGGGEAAGLTKLIKIWDKAHPDLPGQERDCGRRRGLEREGRAAERLKAGNPPDSFQGHAGAELRDYIKAGQVVPIDFIYKQYGFDKVMPKSLLSQIRYKGHLWSVPVNIHRANVLWYNPKTLKANGITVPKTWAQFVAALQKAKDAGLIPLSMGEQWTSDHLWETLMIGVLGPQGWAALWKPGSAGNWGSKGVTTALNRFATLLDYTNSDAASLTWQDAGKLVADGKAAFNVMGDWQDGYFSGSKAGDNLGLKPVKRLRLDAPCPAPPTSTTGSPTASRCPRVRRTARPRCSGWRSSAAGWRRTRSTRSRARSLPGRTRIRSSTARISRRRSRTGRQTRSPARSDARRRRARRLERPTSTRRSGSSCRRRTCRRSRPHS